MHLLPQVFLQVSHQVLLLRHPVSTELLLLFLLSFVSLPLRYALVLAVWLVDFFQHHITRTNNVVCVGANGCPCHSPYGITQSYMYLPPDTIMKTFHLNPSQRG